MLVKRLDNSEKIRFGDLKEGDLFEDPWENKVCIKIEELLSTSTGIDDVNAIYIDNGKGVYFTDENPVNTFQGYIQEEK